MEERFKNIEFGDGTPKQKVWLTMLSLITDENYNFVNEDEASELLENYKDELQKRVQFKYFSNSRYYEENELHIEAYFDDCYIYSFDCICDRKVTKEDTIYTVNIKSVSIYA